MNEVFLCSAARTPIGRYGGALMSLTPAELGAAAASAAIERAQIEPQRIEKVFWGMARQAGAGPNPARQIAHRARVPFESPAMTINQACASGLSSIILGAQEITLNRAEVVLAGGVESMSRTPYYAEGVRFGLRMGDAELVDAMYKDGFFDPLSQMLMGATAEVLAERYRISREEQDDYALGSQQRAARAIDEGKFDDEIVAVETNGTRGEVLKVSRDEHPRRDTTLESLKKLPPVFRRIDEGGTVTAGNSSGITDGAAALVLMSERAARDLNAEPLARIVDYEIAGVAPEVMGVGPVPAIRRLLERQKLSLDEIDLIELNEAFAAQVIACDRELRFDPARLNVNGGAIALGHPIGSTGARITVTLIHEMKRRCSRLGLAALCVSGGMGVAMLIERA